MADKTFTSGTIIDSAWLNDVNRLTYDLPSAVPGKGSGLVGYLPSGTGAVSRTVQDKLREVVSVKDFGAVGTANIANQTADTAAFLAALATGKNVYVPQGTYYISSTVSIGYGQRVYGEGRGKTTVIYSGSGNAFYLGGPGSTTLIYDCELSGMNIVCTSRASTVNGVYLDNAVYFLLSDLGIFGSGSPNAPAPADRTLYGAGVLVTNNSIIGEIRRVSCRQWDIGRYYKTLSGSASFWAAAILDHGQGELATCTYGVKIGDETVSGTSTAGITLQGLTFQGAYQTGCWITTGSSINVQGCYFEGNAAYDVVVGNITAAPQPIACNIIGNYMDSEGIGTNPYGGATTYTNKVAVIGGSFTKIRDNDMSITTSISLIQVDAGADSTSITGNRLNSLAAVTARISNASATTITADNAPEAPRIATGVLVRNLGTSTGSVSYTGLGFRPTSIEFVGAVESTSERFIGWAGLTGSGITSRCLTTDATGSNSNSGDCVRLIRSSAGNEQKATVASFDADGFTLAWTKIGTPPSNDLTVNYIARR